MLPGVGVIDPGSFETASSFGTFFYVGGSVGMVSLIDESGLADALGAKSLAWLPLAPDRPVVVALRLANLRLAAAARLSLLLGSLTLLALVPLDFLRWRYLGYLG